MALSATSKPSQDNNNNGEIQETYLFPQFDVVSDPSDHSYINHTKRKHTNIFSNISSRVHKAIMREWKILEKNLPDSIFVRAYENRIDLLRAVIIGAAGTPYHDGLYFFDIAFPSDYPLRPPNVCYRSFGLRINPNLYKNGYVCLSLLNTWEGDQFSENWNPKKSTVLQVLVSIQGIVLNEKPYEPLHRVWPRLSILEKRSKSFNQDVFALSCKTMWYVLRTPPKNFERFVAEHFRERAHMILSSCFAYVNGQARVGYYSTNGSSSSSSSVEVSGKFKGLIRQLYPELALAFTRNGASLGNLIEHFNDEKEKASCKTQVIVKKKTNGGVARGVLSKLKKILGLKKSGESSVKR